MPGPLGNDKHERFCHALVCAPEWNIRQAYEAAGYAASGASARSAGARLLQNVDVQDRIAELQRERAKRTEITADRVLRELALIGFSDVTDYAVDDAGNVTLAPTANPEAVRALQSVKRKTRTERGKDGAEVEIVDVELRLWNKNTALQDMGKHLGIFGADGSESNPFHFAFAPIDDEARRRRLAELDEITGPDGTGD